MTNNQRAVRLRAAIELAGRRRRTHPDRQAVSPIRRGRTWQHGLRRSAAGSGVQAAQRGDEVLGGATTWVLT
jgi:hypothetical protein